MGGAEAIVTRPGRLSISSGKVVFNRTALFAEGISIAISGDAYFGENFNINRNSFISCSNKLYIGAGTLIGWNVCIRDSDGHITIDNGQENQVKGEVYIGDRVWIAAETHILKNTKIQNDCVVDYHSLCNKVYDGEQLLIAGVPAKIKKKNYTWKK